LNETHRLLVYADDVDILGENIENIEALLLVEKTEYMVVSHNHNLGQNKNLLLANISFEIVAKFKYFGINQNHISAEIKSRLNSGNDCYQPVQSLLSTRVLSKNLNIKIYKKT
jgi:hypothetical protein